MAYTVDPFDQSRPLDTDPRKQGAEELRALKARVNGLQDAAENADEANATAAAAALAAANAAQGAASTALSFAQAITFKNCVELTNTGNWTVPDGVTQVLAIISSGGTASGSKQFFSHIAVGFPYTAYYEVDLTFQRIGHNIKRIAVTPAQVISYECGAGDVVRTDYANIGIDSGKSPNILQSVAQSTRFGGYYAHPEVPYIWQGETSVGIYRTHRLHTRQLFVDVATLDSGFLPHTGAWYNGEAGRIMLFY